MQKSTSSSPVASRSGLHATGDRMQSVNWDDLRYFLEVARTQRASGGPNV